jgi:hypothetical protein
MDIFCNGPVEGGVAVVINFFCELIGYMIQ